MSIFIGNLLTLLPPIHCFFCRTAYFVLINKTFKIHEYLLGTSTATFGRKAGEGSTLPTIRERESRKKNGFIGIYLPCNPIAQTPANNYTFFFMRTHKHRGCIKQSYNTIIFY